MYLYTIQAMPGSKAKFEGDTSVRYQVRRKQTVATAGDKSITAVIRTDVGYTEAAELVQRFNDKELEARAVRNGADSRLTQNF